MGTKKVGKEIKRSFLFLKNLTFDQAYDLQKNLKRIGYKSKIDFDEDEDEDFSRSFDDIINDPIFNVTILSTRGIILWKR